VSLDDLLDEWGTRSRLTAREAEAVRAAVVATRQPGLDAGSWDDLMGQVSATVIGATVLPDRARLALQPGWSGA